MKKRAVVFVAAALLLLLPAGAASLSLPERVFAEELELIDHGRFVERMGLGQPTYILLVTEVEALAAYAVEEWHPKQWETKVDTWDFTQTRVKTQVLGPEPPLLDCYLFLGRNFVSRRTGNTATSSCEHFPDPKLGDRLLLFHYDEKIDDFGYDPPLWAGKANQANTLLVMDSSGNLAVCTSGYAISAGSTDALLRVEKQENVPVAGGAVREART